MKISSKGHWALLAMADIATHQEGGRAVALIEISVRQDVSVAYLEQLFRSLRRAGLVSSARGPRGGYRLARDAAAISAADIVLAVDGSFAASRGDEGRRCATRELWARLHAFVLDYLSSTTLRQLVDGGARAALEAHGKSERAKQNAEFSASVH